MDGARQVATESDLAPAESDDPALQAEPSRDPTVATASHTLAHPSADEAHGRLIIGIPTLGRADVLTPTVRALAAQTKRPDEVILSITAPEDMSPALSDDVPFPIRVLEGEKGSCAQRNLILSEIGSSDIVLFLDDDFLMAPDYLETLIHLFESNPEVAMLTGTVLADGVVGRGLAHEDGARHLRAAAPLTDAQRNTLQDTWNGYGCNFAFRGSVIVENELRFDESLPLYGWLEDVDFSGQVEAHGRLCEAEGLRGVHLGVKVARSSGKRLGYSQIANPIYLRRKNTMRGEHARSLMLRNLASNVVYSIRPRPWTDSRGRLAGNLIALSDWARGRLDPKRVRDL